MESSSRKKSCRQCRIAKTRCSLGTPLCNRCQTRKLPCKYECPVRKPNIFPSTSEGPLFHTWVAATGSTLPVSQLQAQALNNPETSVTLSPSEIPEVSEFNLSPGLNGDFRPEMDWTNWPAVGESSNEQDQAHILDTVSKDVQDNISWFDFPVVNSVPRTNRDSPHLHPKPTNSNSNPRPSKNAREILSQLYLAMSRTSPTVQASLDILSNICEDVPNFLLRKKESNLVALMTGNYIWGRISEYSAAFAEGVLPPFIHKSCLVENKDGQLSKLRGVPEPEALANCRSIIPMFMSRTSGNTILAHKTLLLEVQRLYDEFHQYDAKTLLHALQALTIYTIMAAADKECCKVIGLVVRMGMGEIATEVSRRGCSRASEKRGSFPKWEEWIRAESERRTLILLHLLDILLDINIGIPRSEDCSQLDGVPLPCSKKLWEAGTEREWDDEYRKYLTERKGEGMLLARNLRESKQLESESMDGDIAGDLSTWSEGVDEMGSMLLMGLAGLPIT